MKQDTNSSVRSSVDGHHAEPQVRTHRIDGREHFGAVADERGVPYRFLDLAVPDPVGLGAAEDEIAGGHVHFATPHLLDEDAVGHPGPVRGGC